MATQTVETVTMPCEDWPITRDSQGNLVSITAIAGTWTLLLPQDRHALGQVSKFDVKAIFACPRCAQLGFIPSSYQPKLLLGDAIEASELHCKKCKFVCKVVLKDWDKRKLYCACYETFKGADVIPHKQYLHAENDAEACKYFWAQHVNETLNLVGIAPVIGYFAEDSHNDAVLLV